MFFFVVLCPGAPEGSTCSGSSFKAFQKTGQRLKVPSDRLGEAGNRTCDPIYKTKVYPRRNSHFETDQVKRSHEIQFTNFKQTLNYWRIGI